jgi:hypothetical protein
MTLNHYAVLTTCTEQEWGHFWAVTLGNWSLVIKEEIHSEVEELCCQDIN